LADKREDGRFLARSLLLKIITVVGNCWTAKQADNGLLNRWSERSENDPFPRLSANFLSYFND